MNMSISIATTRGRRDIYRLRHDVYAEVVGQFEVCRDGILPESDDASCVYITAYTGQ